MYARGMEKRKAVIKNIAVSPLLNKRNALRPKTSEIFLEAAPFGGECGSKKQQTAKDSPDRQTLWMQISLVKVH